MSVATIVLAFVAFVIARTVYALAQMLPAIQQAGGHPAAAEAALAPARRRISKESAAVGLVAAGAAVALRGGR